MSKRKKASLYNAIVMAVLEYLDEKISSGDSLNNDEEADIQIEYFGDTLESEEFEIKEDKKGQKYYAY